MRQDDDDEVRDLVRSGVPDGLVETGATLGPADGAEALARVIDQSNREAAASRAQARELVKALEGVQRSQEYLGTALREERRRSWWLLLLVLATPLAAVAGAWHVWAHVDEVRSDLDSRVQALALDAQTARADVAKEKREERASELSGDLAALRRDLDESRDALAVERKRLADRETALAAAESRKDGARVELGALDSEVRSARARANAEAGRADALEKRIHELQSQLEARAKDPPPAAPPVVAPTPTLSPSAAKPAEAAPAPPPQPDASSAEVERTRTVLNTLLAESGDTVRYRFESLGRVIGRTLWNATVVGVDAQGDVARRIQAGRAEIVLDAASGTAVLRFFDGKLLIGTVEAPFFEGAYGLVVRADVAKWRAAGLDLLK